MNKSLSFDNGIIDKDGYSLCPICNSKTMRVSTGFYWDVDQETFKNGERTDEDENVPQSIECNDVEITGYWCDNCNKMIAAWLNVEE